MINFINSRTSSENYLLGTLWPSVMIKVNDYSLAEYYRVYITQCTLSIFFCMQIVTGCNPRPGRSLGCPGPPQWHHKAPWLQWGVQSSTNTLSSVSTTPTLCTPAPRQTPGGMRREYECRQRPIREPREGTSIGWMTRSKGSHHQVGEDI